MGEACVLPVVLVGVRARDAPAGASGRAGLELKTAELAGDEHRALIGVVLPLGEEMPAEDCELAGDGDDRDLRAAAGLDAPVERLQRARSRCDVRVVDWVPAPSVLRVRD